MPETTSEYKQWVAGRIYPYGTFSAIARALAVTPQHVRHVALGHSRSARVERALARARGRVTQKAGQSQGASDAA